MESGNQETKNQHKVPQMLLKHFTFGKKGQLWVFDKLTGRRFRTVPRNVAAERYYYNFNANGKEFSFEPLLGSLETKIAPLVKRIVNGNSIGFLSTEQRAMIGFFAAVQLCRGDHLRDSFRTMNDKLVERLTEWGIGEMGGETVKKADENAVKRFAVEMMQEAGDLAPHFLNKDWVLHKAPAKHAFYIGDNPITLQNLTPKIDWNRGIGLATTGTEIYFPLSSRLMLGMYCPSHLDRIEAQVESYGEEISKPPKFEKTVKMLEDVNLGAAVQVQAESIENMNYLQIRFASRYVYSSTDDFSLVEDMIARDPTYRGGVKIQVG